QRIHRRRREACGNDLALHAPQLAVRAQETAADHRLEQFLDQFRLFIVRRIVQQHALNHVGMHDDVHAMAEDVAFDVPFLERLFGPAVNGRPRPLADEPAPYSDRPVRAWWMRRDVAFAHSAASSVSAPPKSTDTRRLTPFSIMVTP